MSLGGGFRTVSEVPRAFLWFFIACMTTACSNAKLGWQSFSGPPSVALQGQPFVRADSLCSSPFQVALVDGHGRPMPALAPQTFTLNSSGSATFYSNSSCTQTASQVQIDQGASTATFYVTNPAAGTQSLQASGGLGTAQMN